MGSNLGVGGNNHHHQSRADHNHGNHRDHSREHNMHTQHSQHGGRDHSQGLREHQGMRGDHPNTHSSNRGDLINGRIEVGRDHSVGHRGTPSHMQQQELHNTNNNNNNSNNNNNTQNNNSQSQSNQQ